MNQEEQRQLTETTQSVKSLTDKYLDLAEKYVTVNNMLLAVVAIMLIMVAQLVIESWNNKNESYFNLSNQIIEQKVKMDFLYQQLNDGKTININLGN